MAQIYDVMDIVLDGTAFTDENFDSVGAVAFTFRELAEGTGHNFFTQEDLIIRDAAAGGGNLLILNTDYVLSEEDTSLTDRASVAFGATRHVFKKCQIINAAYQAVTLYVSGEWIGDGVDAEYQNNIAHLILHLTADTTIPVGYRRITALVTTGAANKTITLPAISGLLNETMVEIIKVDSGAGKIIIDRGGADTIENMHLTGLTSIEAWYQGNKYCLTNKGATAWVNIHHQLNIVPEVSRNNAWVLNGGSAEAFTAVDFGTYAPVGSANLLLKYMLDWTGNGADDLTCVKFRINGSVITDIHQTVSLRNYLLNLGVGIIKGSGSQVTVYCDSDRIIEYIFHVAAQYKTGTAYLNLEGYYT